MGQDDNIAALRSRVTALVEKESVLLTQAFELSRAGGDRRGVDALFAQVQAMQVERNGLKKKIGDVLGTQRMHVAAEVWRPGVYDYRPTDGDHTVRVCVTSGPLGMQVHLPDQRDPVNIAKLKGSFDGPLAVDDAASHQPSAQSRVADPATAAVVAQAQKAGPRGRAAKKNRA
jgi:hypothetical protein